MKLEDICISLETAKALVGVGLEIESVCWWIEQSYQVPMLVDHKPNVWMSDVKIYPAPTVEELLILLPREIIIKKPYDIYSLIIRKLLYDNIYVNYFNSKRWMLVNIAIHNERLSNIKLCEALAELLLWLKKEGYLG